MGYLKIAYCDDDNDSAVLLDGWIKKNAQSLRIQVELDYYLNGNAIIDSIKSGECYDLIYMDIEMPGINGIDTAKAIKELDGQALLVFITSYESRMRESFDVRPFHYIVKPVDEKEFRRVFQMAWGEMLKNENYFHCSQMKSTLQIPVKDIIYFRSELRKIVIVMRNSNEEFYGKLDKVEEALSNSNIIFLRIHKSFLVNLKYIIKISYEEVRLTNGEVLKISRNRRDDIKNRYINYIEKSKGVDV